MSGETVHIPVLLKETVSILSPTDGDIILDATVGGGGHAEALLSAADVSLIGLDADPAAIARVGWRLSPFGDKVTLRPSNFKVVGSVLDEIGVPHIHKALFDLGLSSDELEQSGRGFSVQKNEPLQMTFDPGQFLTARDLVEHLSQKELADILRNYGEEKHAERIATAIVAHRATGPIERTAELVSIIKEAVPKGYAHGRIHPATKTFQALRIAVNDELNALKDGLESAWEKLAHGGRLAVISFHSLEDRIVKQFMKDKQEREEGIVLFKKPQTASEEELKANPRARSAKLRAIEKK